jgi:hypothetical protein
MYKLLMKAFPSYYKGTSVYAMFPFVHPDRTQEILTDLGKAGDYDFSTPCLQPRPLGVRSYEAVKYVLEDQRQFRVPCEYPQFPLLRHAKILD